MIVALVIVGWLVCGVLAAGLWFADFQGTFSKNGEGWREDLGSGLLIGIFGGPIALFTMFLASGFAQHGWRLWPKKAANG